MNVRELVARAIEEDIGPGDLTTESCVPRGRIGHAEIIAKQPDLVVCGQDVASEVFRQVAQREGGDAWYSARVADGTVVADRTAIARIDAPLRVILMGERLALNLLMKLSGIATNTRAWSAAAEGSALRVVDTRKTTPLLRELEKYAVRCGGGHNHRMALFDGVMVKDNHIRAAGGIEAAVRAVRARVHHLVRIEVEVTTLAELDEALAAGADVVLLDNMSDDLLKACVQRTRSTKPETILEASGNMNPERIARIKDIGLDVVSAGGLIHQATWVDFSLAIRGVEDAD